MTENFRPEVDRLFRGQIRSTNTATSPATGFRRFVVSDGNARPGSVCLVQNNLVTVIEVTRGKITFEAPSGGISFQYGIFGAPGGAARARPVSDGGLLLVAPDSYLLVAPRSRLRIS